MVQFRLSVSVDYRRDSGGDQHLLRLKATPPVSITADLLISASLLVLFTAAAVLFLRGPRVSPAEVAGGLAALAGALGSLAQVYAQFHGRDTKAKSSR